MSVGEDANIMNTNDNADGDDDCEDILTRAIELLIWDMIYEESRSVYFELHRAIKLGYYKALYPPESCNIIQKVEIKEGCDIFGQDMATKKALECLCPQCKRPIAASRLAPHLEKCMGMGRNSSRLASRRIQASGRQTTAVDNDLDIGDDESDEYQPNEPKRFKVQSGSRNLKRVQKEKKIN